MAKKSKKIEISTKQGIGIAAVCAVVLAGIVAVAFFSFAATCSVGKSAGCPTVKYGNKGSAVRVLQTELKRVCYQPKIAVDGQFGTNTQADVKGFQKETGLKPVDGKAGPKTWARLDYWYKFLNSNKASAEFDCY